MPAIPDPGRASSPMLVLPLVALAALILAFAIWPRELLGASFGDFLFVSVAMGGSAAWQTGNAVARGWGSFVHLVVYAILLTAAVRFCHFALFQDDLFSLQGFALELVLLMAIATLGFRAVRRRQMTVQYGWLFESTGSMAWRPRA